MASVRRLRSGTWQGWYQDYEGRRVFFTLAATATRREVLQAARELEVHHAQIRRGLLPAPTAQTAALARPIGEVMEEYLAWGTLQGSPGGRPWALRHAQQRAAQLAWWRTRLQLTTLGECLGILPTVERAVQALAGQGFSGQTIKHYRNALAAFCTWCWRREYLPSDPLARRTPLHASPRRIRRALTVDEIHQLLETCAPRFQLLYVTALATGLRLGELRQLSLAHLDLDRGGLRLDAAWTKNRQTGFQRLPEALVAALHASARTAEPLRHYGRSRLAVPASPLLYAPRHMARCLREDLRRAGIPPQTPQGVIDFHALRTTYINLVLGEGATPAEAQELARHQRPEMTIGVYGRTHATRLAELTQRVAERILPETLRAPGVHAQVVGSDIVQEPRGDDARRLQPLRLVHLAGMSLDHPMSVPHSPESMPHLRADASGDSAVNPQLIYDDPHPDDTTPTPLCAPDVHAADPDLQHVLATWPTLPAERRAAILAFLKEEPPHD